VKKTAASVAYTADRASDTVDVCVPSRALSTAVSAQHCVTVSEDPAVSASTSSPLCAVVLLNYCAQLSAQPPASKSAPQKYDINRALTRTGT